MGRWQLRLVEGEECFLIFLKMSFQVFVTLSSGKSMSVMLMGKCDIMHFVYSKDLKIGSFHLSPSGLYASVVIHCIYAFVINAGICCCSYLNSQVFL